MSLSKPLLNRPQPKTDESLSGYFLRLTESNFYESCRWIFDLAKISQHQYNANLLEPQKNDFFTLSELTGVAEEKLWSMTFLASQQDGSDNSIKLFNHSLPGYFIHKKTTKICPICLQESPYRRKIWDISLVTTCPIHRCLLVDKCCQCGKFLNWSQSSVVRCKCEQDWRQVTPIFVETSEVILSKIIYFSSEFNQTNSFFDANNPLRTIHLENLLKAVIFIAGQLSNTCDTTGKFIGVMKPNSKIHSVLYQALQKFDHWPENFFAFLDWRKNQELPSPRSIGINKDFGSFYRKLYTDFPKPTYSFLHEAFETYLTQNWDGGYLNVKLSRLHESICEHRNFIPATEAAKQLGTSEASIVRLVQLGKLEGTTKTMGKRMMTLVKIGSLASYQKKQEKALKTTEVANFLGIGNRTVVDLVAYSCIQALRGPSIDGYSRWLIESESPEILIKNLDAAVEVGFHGEGEIISFSIAVRKLSGLQYTTGKFTRLILDGLIQPCGKRMGTGLEQYSFRKEDIEGLIRQSVQADKATFLTVRDVAQRLGIKQEVAAFWMDKGLIPCEYQTPGKSRRHRQVKTDEIEEFRNKYVTAIQLSQELGTSPRKLTQMLMKQNIIPVTGHCIDGGRQYLFKRDDIKIDELQFVSENI
ncbi:TniQ family protein [Lyngbya sp. PCC 8106]|uniref:TniQ family protein n=1 Tax=Lyngbya sp. (strain PCC 8106) TaxID=313612 RepID=UPI0000EA9F2D|nr:TniQ family protein [Lyngbya sp. PCC 8106]EAW36769.1 hypothetical protein L8106_29995 [Lyngbya sp. PCC 8106]